MDAGMWRVELLLQSVGEVLVELLLYLLRHAYL